MDKITQMLENVVRCKYFEAGVHIKNPIKNSNRDGSGRTLQTLDHVIVVHILIWGKRKSQINENIVVKVEYWSYGKNVLIAISFTDDDDSPFSSLRCHTSMAVVPRNHQILIDALTKLFLTLQMIHLVAWAEFMMLSPNSGGALY
jgi:hypothetical protein